MENKTFIINATAIKHGGALTILKEFLKEVEKSNNTSVYYVFSGNRLTEFRSDNIKIINIKTNGFGIGGIKRILWDLIGLYIYCGINKLTPDLIISFQNTGVFFPKIKQLIYYHQPIPLFKNKWKFYKRNEYTLFFYKKIYPLFIRLFLNKNTEFVVQQHFIKKLFSIKFNIPDKKIHVVKPDVIINDEFKMMNLDKDKYHIFYPTNLSKYKNYDVLLEAILEIKKISPEIFKKIILHITLDKSNKDTVKKISKYQISNNVNLLGSIPYCDVISYYNSVNLLVFPSYIETFGLPLIEAASFGLPILASDLDYAHEVLNDYEGVKYVEYDNVQMWANMIIELSKTNQKYESCKTRSINNSWTKFIELSNKMIESDV